MKLLGTATDEQTVLPAPVVDASAGQAVESVPGADDESAWWWGEEQAKLYPAQWAVLETNQVLDHLEALQYVVAQMAGVNVVVPRAVVKELEFLEGVEQPEGGRPAEAALRYLRSKLLALGGYRCGDGGDRSSLLMQGEGEAIYDGLHGRLEGTPHGADDHILACARHFATVVAPDMTELLTSDRRLAIKAASHSVPSESVLMLMGRGIISSGGCQAVDVEGPPGLGAPALLSTAAGHAVNSYNSSPSDTDREAERSVQQKGDDSFAPGPGDASRHSQDESSSGGSCARGLGVVTVGKRVGHGCAASTRSPSSEDGCGDPTEAFSSPDFSHLGSPPGLVPQATPPWHHIPDVGHDEVQEEDDMQQEEEKRVWSKEPSADEHCGKGRAGADATSVVLRGLPFNVTEEEVLTFIRKAGVSRELLAPDGVVALLANAQGRPSGFAEVRLAQGANLRDVRVRLHMQHLRGRYIEALPPRPVRKSAAKRQVWNK